MGAIFELQRSLYMSAIHALSALHTAGPAGLRDLIATAFGFGMLHALLPGHGKSVLASYYAGDGRLRGALGSSALFVVTHVGSAIILVLAGLVVLQRTIAGPGRAPAIELASQILIVLIGLWVLWRALRSRPHDHDPSAPALAIATGLVPCPLTTFVMTYAVTNGVIASGLVLSGAFAVGMVVTVAAFPLLTVILRTKLLSLMTRTEAWRSRVGRGLEIVAGAALILIGAQPLLSSW
jgi:ABC-type nickel/cobalt efflux system permease component RcnA